MSGNDSRDTRIGPYSDPRRQALLSAANDSARLFRSIFLAFLLASLYFLVLALSADDELLFKDGDLRAPILNVTIQASHYFIAAPWIFMLLHVNFLIQGVFLFRKVADYTNALPSRHEGNSREELLRLLFPVPWAQMAGGVSSSGVPLWLLRAFVSFTLAILPLVTLGVMQVQFLDYQSTGITTMHMGVLLLDLAFLWFLWHRMNNTPDQDPGSLGWGQRFTAAVRQSWPSFATTLLVVSVFFTISVWRPSDVAQGDESEYLGDWLRSVHFLDVQQKRLYLGSDSIMPEDACEDPTLALNLSGRTYRSVNLAESVLCNVVLTDANLERAVLRGADLRGANLSNARLHGAVLTMSQMQGAMLAEARLYGASLQFAQLQGANLEGAYLVAVSMSSAQAQGASLVGTKLWYANLTGNVGFQGANLDRAEFQEANLVGANFQRARLTGGRAGTTTTTELDGRLTQDEVNEAADELAVAMWGNPTSFTAALRQHVRPLPVLGTHTAITDRGAVVVVEGDEVDAFDAEYARAVCGAFYPNLQLLQRVKSNNTLRGIPLETIRDWIQDGRCPEGLDAIMAGEVGESPEGIGRR